MIVHAGKDFVPHTNESLTSFVEKSNSSKRTNYTDDSL